jgi:sulfur carrier protein ThiS
VSHNVRRQIAVERKLLRQLLETHRELLAKCATTAPNAVELSALAAMLHAFYTGIENIFKRIAIEVDGDFVRSDQWHQILLKRMALPAPSRPPVISENLRRSLKDYLDFRHFFRHGYTFQLRWEKMAPLVRNCEEVFQGLESELDAFCSLRGI